MTDTKTAEIVSPTPKESAPLPPQSNTAAEVAIQHLHYRLHELEQAVAGFLSHEQHQHPKVVTWLENLRNRASGLFHATPGAATTSQPSESTEDTAESSTSKTSA